MAVDPGLSWRTLVEIATVNQNFESTAFILRSLSEINLVDFLYELLSEFGWDAKFFVH